MTLLDGKPLEHERPVRKQDPIWDALLAVCGVETGNVTRSARGAYNKSAADLRLLKATPEDIQDHAEVFRTLWPHVTLTPTALVRRWAETMPRKKPAMTAKIVRPVECPKCVNGWLEQDDGTVIRCQH